VKCYHYQFELVNPFLMIFLIYYPSVQITSCLRKIYAIARLLGNNVVSFWLYFFGTDFTDDAVFGF